MAESYGLAPAANARSAVENFALAFWLLDSEKPPERRVCRSLAWRYDSNKNARKFVRKANPHADTRESEEESQRLSLLWNSRRECRGIRFGGSRKELRLDKAMPNFTGLVAELLNEKGFYELLSGLTHGDPKVSRLLGWSCVSTEDHPRILEKSVDPMFSILVCYVTAKAHANAARALFGYFGWDLTTLSELLEPLEESLDGLADMSNR